MQNKISERKFKDFDIIGSYIPRRIRYLDCHKIHIHNAMISTEKNDDFTKGEKL